jgi:hypothetical protein
VDAQNAPTGIWKSRTEREIPTASTSIRFSLGRRKEQKNHEQKQLKPTVHEIGSGPVVDIWHADADGLYSNVGADLQEENTVGQTFMRGHQVADATGMVEFNSVVPGWEIGRNVARTTHVHVKVFHENKVVTR